MPNIQYNYIKHLNGVGSYASVELEITPNDLGEHRVFSNAEKVPFQSQGLWEGGHPNWESSAELALKAALQNLHSSQYFDILIRKLMGRIFIDTNNATIGVACILALWKYLEIEPDPSTLTKMHALVGGFWHHEPEVMPDFQMLFSNPA